MVLIGFIGGGLFYRHVAQERDSRGATRLMRALEEDDTQKMEKLLNKEEVNLRDKSGQTPLFYAARHTNQPQVIHKLLLAGADALATDKDGNTPLMVAAQYNPNPAVTMALAKQGGFSKKQTHNKNKALFLASQYNRADIIKALLVANASPAVEDANQHPAADYLATNEQLSEQEKTDLRQVMLVLEILEERELFSPVEETLKPTLKQMSDSQPKKQESAPTQTQADPATANSPAK